MLYGSKQLRPLALLLAIVIIFSPTSAFAPPLTRPPIERPPSIPKPRPPIPQPRPELDPKQAPIGEGKTKEPGGELADPKRSWRNYERWHFVHPATLAAFVQLPTTAEEYRAIFGKDEVVSVPVENQLQAVRLALKDTERRSISAATFEEELGKIKEFYVLIGTGSVSWESLCHREF